MAERAAPPPAGIGWTDPKMRRRLVTPEGVDLGLTLAGMGQRLAAFAIDLCFMLLFQIAISVIALLLAIGGPRGSEGVMVAIWLPLAVAGLVIIAANRVQKAATMR